MAAARPTIAATLFMELLSRRASLRLLAMLVLGGGSAAVEAAHPVNHVQHRAAKRRQRQHHRLKQRRRTQQHQANNGAESAAPTDISFRFDWVVDNFTATNQPGTFWWFYFIPGRDNPRPWSPLRDVDIPVSGEALGRQAAEMVGVELAYRHIFIQFVSDGPHRNVNVNIKYDGKMDRIGYLRGTLAAQELVPERGQFSVTIGERTLKFFHHTDAQQIVNVRIVIA